MVEFVEDKNENSFNILDK